MINTVFTSKTAIVDVYFIGHPTWLTWSFNDISFPTLVIDMPAFYIGKVFNLHVALAYGFFQTHVVNGGRKIPPNSTKNIFRTTEPI